MTEKRDENTFAEKVAPFTAPPRTARQGGCFIPTEADAEAALAGMRPEVRKAYEESKKQFAGLYKKLADM